MTVVRDFHWQIRAGKEAATGCRIPWYLGVDKQRDGMR